MEKQERNRNTERLFTLLMRRMADGKFIFPGGGIASRTVNACLDELEEISGDELSMERITDFCVCQVHAFSNFDKEYSNRRIIALSFGSKAIERYRRSNSRVVYYEDQWLRTKGLTRNILVREITGKKEHPLAKFIFPEYEEKTKQRLHNTQTGFCVCQLSTMLWTPFSPSCRKCDYSEKCRVVLRKHYPELFRIRNEAFSNQPHP